MSNGSVREFTLAIFLFKAVIFNVEVNECMLSEQFRFLSSMMAPFNDKTNAYKFVQKTANILIDKINIYCIQYLYTDKYSFGKVMDFYFIFQLL